MVTSRAYVYRLIYVFISVVRTHHAENSTDFTDGRPTDQTYNTRRILSLGKTCDSPSFCMPPHQEQIQGETGGKLKRSTLEKKKIIILKISRTPYIRLLCSANYIISPISNAPTVNIYWIHPCPPPLPAMQSFRTYRTYTDCNTVFTIPRYTVLCYMTVHYVQCIFVEIVELGETV